MNKRINNVWLGVFIGCVTAFMVFLVGWAIDSTSFDEEQAIGAYAKVENIDVTDAKTLLELENANIATRDSVTYISVPYEDICIVSAYDVNGKLLYRNIEKESIFSPYSILGLTVISFILAVALIFIIKFLIKSIQKIYDDFDKKKKTKMLNRKKSTTIRQSEYDRKPEGIPYTEDDSEL